MIKKFLLFTISLLFVFNSANSVQLPRTIGKEKRFRAYIYNPNEVYRYIGYYLSQTYIEFEEGEVVKTISMGDTTAWQTTVMENKLFLKPVGSYPDTNMTVLTNKRTYYFELDAVDTASSIDDNVLFYVKFIYPEGDDKNIVLFNTASTRDDKPDLRDLGKYNFNYEFSGSPAIAPIKVFDDGEFTYIEFADKNAEIPAIFSVNSAGYENLVNFRVVENYIVIEQVNTQFTLRSSEDIVCIYNNGMYKNVKR